MITRERLQDFQYEKVKALFWEVQWMSLLEKKRKDGVRIMIEINPKIIDPRVLETRVVQVMNKKCISNENAITISENLLGK